MAFLLITFKRLTILANYPYHSAIALAQSESEKEGNQK
jgi:hypothetical protein